MTGSRSEGLDAPGSLSVVLRFSVFLECLSTLYYFDASSCVPRFFVSFFFFYFLFLFWQKVCWRTSEEADACDRIGKAKEEHHYHCFCREVVRQVESAFTLPAFFPFFLSNFFHLAMHVCWLVRVNARDLLCLLSFANGLHFLLIRFFALTCTFPSFFSSPCIFPTDFFYAQSCQDDCMSGMLAIRQSSRRRHFFFSVPSFGLRNTRQKCQGTKKVSKGKKGGHLLVH